MSFLANSAFSSLADICLPESLLCPFLISDGGNIEYVKFEDGIVYVKMMGHCQDCPMLDVTLKDSIEIAIVNEIPEVIEVRNISE